MKLSALIDRVSQQEAINFYLTNHIPRRLATRFVSWFARIEHPVVRDLSIATWTLFAGDLRLHEAKEQTFRSLRDCFIRELRAGARPVDTDARVGVSPCDGIVGAAGDIRDNELLQAKGSAYTLDELLGGDDVVERYRLGRYVTLRLTSNMYHRFHAPCDCAIERVVYIAGDMWNVNPVTLNRIPRLYCRNERAILHARAVPGGNAIALVAVAAVLVAGIHLNCVDVPLTPSYRGATRLPCRATFHKGQELGFFEHGSTIIVVASEEFELCPTVRTGELIRMGEPLVRLRDQYPARP